MKLDRKHLLILLAVLVIGGFLVMRWYENKKAAEANNNGQANNLGPTGSNLNSIAPELVGGSTGPSIGPAMSVPIDITVTSSAPPAAANPIGDMNPVQPVGWNAMQGQSPSMGQLRMNPVYRMGTTSNSATGAQDNSPLQNAGT